MKWMIALMLLFLSSWNLWISEKSNYEIRTEELIKELGYKKKTKRAVRLRDKIREDLKQQEIPEDKSEAIIPPGVVQFFKFLGIVLILILVGAVVLVLIHFIRPRFNGQQKVPELEDDLNDEEIDDISATDIETLLESALRKGDYRAAIRALFLQNLQLLDKQKSIYWQKHKTNRDYLRETRGQKQYDPFLSMVSIYERVWYGSNEIDAETYQSLSPEFGVSLVKIDYQDGQ